MSIAVVGTGRMGGAMVARLRQAGHHVLAYNRTRPRAAAVAEATGAELAASAADAVTAADVVFVSLADDAALRDAYGADDGIAAGVQPGTIVLETSTVHPNTIREVAPLVEARGGVLLDAPVSGSVPVVERGELTFMVGGDAEALERVRPVLDALAAKVFHLGPLGSGAIVKLAVNDVVHGLNQALSEALVLAERAGVERSRVYEVFAASAIAAPFVQYKRAAFEDPESAPVAFALDLVAKDLELIDALASSVDARMPQLATNRRVVAEALAAGLGDRDLSALAELLRQPNLD
jgi:3-hydroxyisobutyrate dehydrogenase/2-hydroxy-3-oxopropionate reductase